MVGRHLASRSLGRHRSSTQPRECETARQRTSLPSSTPLLSLFRGKCLFPPSFRYYSTVLHGWGLEHAGSAAGPAERSGGGPEYPISRLPLLCPSAGASPCVGRHGVSPGRNQWCREGGSRVVRVVRCDRRLQRACGGAGTCAGDGGAQQRAEDFVGMVGGGRAQGCKGGSRDTCCAATPAQVLRICPRCMAPHRLLASAVACHSPSHFKALESLRSSPRYLQLACYCSATEEAQCSRRQLPPPSKLCSVCRYGIPSLLAHRAVVKWALTAF
jgi:hypothetical protein